MPFPTIEPTVPALLRWCGERFGSADFLIAGGRTLSYADLNRRSARLGMSLLRHGVGKGDHVGILMPNSVDWAVAWFAVTRIGAVAVPINTFSKPRELAWTVRHADLRAVLAWADFGTNDFLARLEEALPGLDRQRCGRIAVRGAPFLRTVAVWGSPDRRWATPVADDALGDAPGDVPGVDAGHLTAVEACVTPADDVAVIYTSGSTGDPKGAVHSHGALIRHSFNLTHVYVVRPGDVLFTSMPFFWVGGLITGLHAVVHHGATLVTQPAFDPADALRLIETHRATITLGWPQQGRTLSEHPDFAIRDLSSVRRTSMPAMVPPDRRPVACDSLGMTELCGNHLGADPYAEQPPHRRDTVGPSIDGLTHRIADPETGEPVPTGQTGEIWVRGYSLMQRLHKREREDVFTEDGYYRTGDCGAADADGWIRFTGRLGDLIKTGSGTNVTPAEVESALCELPGVLEAYVVGARDPHGATVVAAAAVPGRGHELDAAALRDGLRTMLSAYKIPRHIWVADKADLPFTDTGKIVRSELAEQLSARLRQQATADL
ncbi:class I adenylate-forming enzyme family protein [Mycolicibacterium thermoresistibile]|uniref:AMP-dependent synthetase and ligase n=2 Tax=Mycolicibacterium thermoresistibile TaxID=1797 RepID=G7CN11_MYCT3|nr:class I adenylate-forming enzyme family protein [Mycolicibacterium thermoresistibile]EHI10500.1 AMP-dependent synthetase and ligase [Mycolicibacterium thermoresistibile ATCC 19527]MCV7189639.1 acyl--CoA ligase [Mycolicibacterium thermoresistibile]GAT15448.1 acyl-CoA synthetase family member 2 [Mycolicibacterium thermoresistibile]SNW17507.1 acyl-CoA synthetase family member 2 [Mycolicibacterium thermoresistibile]